MLQCNVCYRANRLESVLGKTVVRLANGETMAIDNKNTTPITEQGITRSPNGVVLRAVCDECLKKGATK